MGPDRRVADPAAARSRAAASMAMLGTTGGRELLPRGPGGGEGCVRRW